MTVRPSSCFPSAARQAPFRAAKFLSVIALGAATCLGSGANAEETVRWRMNSLLFPKVFGEAGMRFADTVRVLSDGTLDIEFNDRLVYDEDTFTAMKTGLIDVVWGSAGHHHREDPALALFTGFPFGPDGAEFSAWMRYGGGEVALNAIYARHGLKSVYCGVLPPEGGGWFREEIHSVEDLEGLNMRVFGLGGLAMRKLGVVPFEMPAGEVKPAFENGVLDAAEFSFPSIDIELGISDVAKHLYLPGWQQPVTQLELLLPIEKYERLSEWHKAVIDAACGDSVAWTFAKFTMDQIDTLQAFRGAGVEIHRWPPEILTELERAWEMVIAEETAADPLLAEAWQNYLSFREEYRAYRDLAYPD
jgi:TRAP-type mannitol/chloroaromatic compound transport system substrate-binding protein